MATDRSADDELMRTYTMRKTSTFVVTATVAALLLGASSLLAQSATTKPAVESAGSVLDRMLPNAPKDKPVAPAANASGGPSTRPGVAPGAPAASVMREGTLLVDRTGRIVRTPDGSQVEFVF